MYVKLWDFEFDPFGALAKERAIEKYDNALSDLHGLGAKVQRSAEALYQFRLVDCKSAVEACEGYVSRLANAPREFEAAVSELTVEYGNFSLIQEALHAEAEKINLKAGGTAGGGIAAGVGVAAFAPTAAMAVATTFGAASTGTAISALSGAAATNAALAWLGGGALAAGGGGMAAGNALLALAGPIGWAIGGAALIGAGLLVGGKNGEVVKQAYEALGKVEADKRRLDVAQTQVASLERRSREHVAGIRDQLSVLMMDAPRDYLAFGQDDRDRLKALINNVRSLGAVMGERVNPD